MTQLPNFIQTILETLETAGHPAYLVGGPVRDLVMGKTPTDWDIATAAAPETVQALFFKTIPTGLKHGTVTVVTEEGHVEVTTFRRDGAYQDHRRPAQVDFVTDLREDLARRDFTINAMALDLRGNLSDPFGGQSDIAAKRIRAVGDPEVRFEEDALRMFRAFRFSAQLGFSVDPEALGAIRANSHLAASLSAERVRDEVEKILLSPRPEILADVLDAGLLTGYVDFVGAQPLQNIRHLPLEKTCRWAAFAACGADLGTFRLDNRTITTATAAATLAPHLPQDVVGLKRLLARHGADAVQCAAEISTLVGRRALLDTILTSGECYSLESLAVTGADLIAAGFPPGPELGECLARLLDHAIVRPADNQREVLLRLL